MKNQIEIRTAVTPEDAVRFWEELRAYHARDNFPDPKDREDLDYFLGEEYRAQIQALHDRPQNPLYYLFFIRNGQEIGFAMPVLHNDEEGKCFLMEFCVYPPFRGNGTGTACAQTFLAWSKERGAVYWELNCDGERRVRFWHRLGFIPNGVDEWGTPLMLIPPQEKLPITVEVLSDPKNWQLLKLENSFLAEIGEEPLTEERQESLRRAISTGDITFFFAMRDCRVVGMCSVSPSFSTFSCGKVGTFDDFYVEPAFRKQGIARKLAKAAQEWCRENGVASLTVCCAPCDEEMYQALGFDAPLGRTFSKLI